jgi:hypothetical protein
MMMLHVIGYIGPSTGLFNSVHLQCTFLWGKTLGFRPCWYRYRVQFISSPGPKGEENKRWEPVNDTIKSTEKRDWDKNTNLGEEGMDIVSTCD